MGTDAWQEWAQRGEYTGQYVSIRAFVCIRRKVSGPFDPIADEPVARTAFADGGLDGGRCHGGNGPQFGHGSVDKPHINSKRGPKCWKAMQTTGQ